jgi:nucleoid-associated protein YgaU
MGLEKARIVNLDKNEEIPCLFNPNRYTLDKTNSWIENSVLGGNVSKLEFQGGQSETLGMQLFFDTNATGEDVRKYTNKVLDLMSIEKGAQDMTSGKGRPPMVEFRWGGMWTFKAVITNIKQTFTLFRESGIPVRATLDVSFLQAKEVGIYAGQNPTTVGIPGYKHHIVKEGDTVDWIAFEEYGDCAMWRYIAETNHLDNPSSLKPGQILAISPPP